MHRQGREPVLAKVGWKEEELLGVGRIGLIEDFSPTALSFSPSPQAGRKIIVEPLPPCG